MEIVTSDRGGSAALYVACQMRCGHPWRPVLRQNLRGVAASIPPEGDDHAV